MYVTAHRSKNKFCMYPFLLLTHRDIAGYSTEVKIQLYVISMTQLRSHSDSLACVTEHSSITRQIEMCVSMTSIQQYHFLFTCNATPILLCERLYKKYKNNFVCSKRFVSKDKTPYGYRHNITLTAVFVINW